MNTDTLLIEMQYLAPIEYYSNILSHQKILIEQFEHFEKSTYRNRCYIAGPNGALRLSIPLEKGKNQHTVIKDVRISYDFAWQKIHWQSLCSVYRTSPYFEFYEDKLSPFYENNFIFLFDFNEQLMMVILQLLDLHPQFSKSTHYEKSYEGSIKDCRSKILPNKINDFYYPPKYQQVFESNNGFLPNMSIVDLLFCEGPEGVNLLK